MNIAKATAGYEAWLRRHLRIVKEDIEAKHEAMRAGEFPFFRATYYRWAQLWPRLCEDLAGAPKVLGVGDLHVENFGTWRDAEGRLIWGSNDFDEAWRLPYTNDLVRLAASALLTAPESGRKTELKHAAQAILAGYRDSLQAGGRPLVLAEDNLDLRQMAVARLKDPGVFWRKLNKLPPYKGKVPKLVMKALSRAMPARGLKLRNVHRIAGLGSLGRERFVALAEWKGGEVAREAKALAPSACAWAAGISGSPRILYQDVLDESVRCRDPFVRMREHWIVRRLAPDCSRIELSDLPKIRDEERLLYFMGWETANVHLGTAKAKAILKDLKRRRGDWLHAAAERMLKATGADWKEWKKVRPSSKVSR